MMMCNNLFIHNNLVASQDQLQVMFICIASRCNAEVQLIIGILLLVHCHCGGTCLLAKMHYVVKMHYDVMKALNKSSIIAGSFKELQYAGLPTGAICSSVCLPG